jgi:hypothetical protein
MNSQILSPNRYGMSASSNTAAILKNSSPNNANTIIELENKNRDQSDKIFNL